MLLDSISNSTAITAIIFGILSLVARKFKTTTSTSLNYHRRKWWIKSISFILILFGIHALYHNLSPAPHTLDTSPGRIIHTAWYLVLTHILISFLDSHIWNTPPHLRGKTSVPPRVLYHLAVVITSLIVFILIIQNVYGVSIPTELVISSGILAAVIGFAAKDILSDMVAGLVLSIDRPFKKGNWIELDDQKTLGKVTDISWRATKVLTWFNTIKSIPNSSIIRQTVNNLSAPEPAYAHWFYIHIPAETSITLTRRTLLQACLDTDSVLEDPAPVVRLWDMEHRPYKYMVYTHFNNYETFFKSKDQLLNNINNALAEEGISVSAKAVDVDYFTHDQKRTPIHEYSNKELIEKVKVFQLLDDNQRERLLEEMNIIHYDSGEVILDEGDTNDALYIIASGKIKVTITAKDGATHIIERMRPGNYFGVMSLLAGEPSQEKYISSGESQILQFTQATLEPIFQEHPELMKEIAEFLAQQKINRLTTRGTLPTTQPHETKNPLTRYAKEILNNIQTAFKP